MGFWKFYGLCAVRAFGATVSSQNLKVRKLVFQGLGLLIAGGLAWEAGLSKIVTDKGEFLLFALAAGALLFLAEYIYNFVRAPWLLALEGLPKPAKRATTERLKELYESGSAMHDKEGLVSNLTRKRRWIESVVAELDAVAPEETFGFESIGKGSSKGPAAAVELPEKLNKLRLIILRLEKKSV